MTIIVIKKKNATWAKDYIWFKAYFKHVAHITLQDLFTISGFVVKKKKKRVRR